MSAFAGALDVNEHGFVWWKFVLQDVTVGFASGLLVGYLASRVLPARHGLPALANPAAGASSRTIAGTARRGSIIPIMAPPRLRG